jgi:hypothetical protein
MDMNSSEFKLNLAVVVGINDYQNGVPALGTARQDAEAIARILRDDYQYQVIKQLCLAERSFSTSSVTIHKRDRPMTRIFYNAILKTTFE